MSENFKRCHIEVGLGSANPQLVCFTIMFLFQKKSPV